MTKLQEKASLLGEALNDDVKRRFWDRVKKSQGCWIWTGAIDKYGRGYIHSAIGVHMAHRVSLEMAGRLPENMIVRHDCDNPSCVNPDHLRPGTQADNMRDAATRNRMPRGECNVRCVLSDKDVNWIHSNRGILKQSEMSRVLRVHQCTISRILAKKRRKHFTLNTTSKP